VAKRKNYATSQGQNGIASGIETGIPFSLANPASVANGAIPVASFPLEVPIWTCPDRIVLDAFNSAYRDVQPSTLEPAVQAFLQAVRFNFNAAFALAANSFIVDLVRRTAAGGAAQVVATLLDGTVTTIVAFAQIIIPVASIANMPMNVGDSLNIRVRIQGAGAPCPAFGGVLDLQM
jgi:hypothetical protein